MENVIREMEIKKGLVNQMKPLEKCWGENCVTVGYSIIGDSDPENFANYNWIDDMMRSVSEQNNLEF